MIYESDRLPESRPSRSTTAWVPLCSGFLGQLLPLKFGHRMQQRKSSCFGEESRRAGTVGCARVIAYINIYLF